MKDAAFYEAQAKRVDFLRDEAKALKVRWDKGLNYFSSFFSELERLRPQISDELLNDWCFWNMGMGIKTIRATAKLLEDEDATRVREQTKMANEISKAKAAAERRAVALEKAAAEAVEEEARRQQEVFEATVKEENLKAEKEAKAKEEEKKRQAKLAKNRATYASSPDQQIQNIRRKNRNRRIMKENLVKNGPDNLDLQRLLAECDEIEKPTRAELGRRYLIMKTIVENRQAGRNWHSEFWTWTGWVATYLNRSRQDVHKCIQAYQELTQNPVASCDNVQDENVIAFEKNVA